MARAMPSAVRSLPHEIGVPSGRTVVRQGEPCPRPMVVIKGAMYVCTVDDQGRVLGLDVAGPGDVVGDLHAVPARATARALGACRLAPAPERDLLALFHERERRLSAFACQLAWLDVPGRVHQRIHDLAHRFGRPVPGGTLIALGLTQEQLAHLCGTSRESANRALQASIAEGQVRVLGRGRYLVPVDQASSASFGASPASCNITRLQVLQ
jgi:CRP/FNR family transcriptional regulator, cyclic AMP receptor protein